MLPVCGLVFVGRIELGRESAGYFEQALNRVLAVTEDDGLMQLHIAFMERYQPVVFYQESAIRGTQVAQINFAVDNLNFRVLRCGPNGMRQPSTINTPANRNR